MSETIWMLRETSGFPEGEFAPPLSDWEDADAVITALEAFGSCEPLPPEFFPKRLVEIKEVIEHEGDYLEAGLTPPRRKLFPLPPVFSQSLNLIFVNETTAALLSEFRLGRTELHKLELFAQDGKTPYEGCAYWLHLLENHPCFNVDLSKDFAHAGYVDIPGRGKTERWMVYRGEENTVLSEPLPELDLWRDPQVFGALFVRDRLAEALKKQKGSKKLRFVRCKVVEV